MHLAIVAIAAFAAVAVSLRSADDAVFLGIANRPDSSLYDDAPIRWGVIATMFWGLAGLAAGLYIALQLAFPVLNLDLEYTSFGRLRPLHTSAVIFAFGGNALIATSFYVVQRTCRARLAFPSLARFVFWGYQLFIVLAATGYLLGITEGTRICRARMVCRPVADDRLGRLRRGLRRHDRASGSEPHIYVANWFYLELHPHRRDAAHGQQPVSMPVSLVGSKSYSAVRRRAGCADPMVVWPQRGRLLPDRRLPGDDVLLRARSRRERPIYSYRLSIIHFWSLIFLYIWAGPHHLHYTALPDWAQTLGMVFSIMLWMPSWGGMINGLMTLNGAWDKIRTDPIIRMMVMALAFYGMSTFEGPMLSIKAVNSLSPLYRLDDRPRPFRARSAGTA